MNLHLTALVKSKSGKEAALEKELLSLVRESTKEEACIKYELHQSVCDDTMFIFHEIWADETGLYLHNQTPYIRNFSQIAEDLVEGKIVIYKTKIIAQGI